MHHVPWYPASLKKILPKWKSIIDMVVRCDGQRVWGYGARAAYCINQNDPIFDPYDQSGMKYISLQDQKKDPNEYSPVSATLRLMLLQLTCS